MINLAYKRRTWSVAQKGREAGRGLAGSGDSGSDSIPPRALFSQTSAPVDSQRGGAHRRNKSDSPARSPADSWRPETLPGNTGSQGTHSNHSTRTGTLGEGGGGSPRKLQFVRASSSNTDKFSLDGGSQYNASEISSKTATDRCVDFFYHLLLNNVPFLEDDWRAARELERCEILWNFWIAIFGLMACSLGTTIIGLAFVGQNPVLYLASTYKEYHCSVSGGDIVQYSLEGYVESHWVPLQVTVLNASDSSSGLSRSSSSVSAPSSSHALLANVTGVSGGWAFLDRFPMPPVHGRITDVPTFESFYSNDVGMSEDVARSWVDNHIGRVFPCLVPTNLQLVNDEERYANECSPTGLYPFAWTLEDLLTKGSFKYDKACTSQPSAVNRVLVPNADERIAEANHKSNYGSHFACRGRIVFVNATFASEVEPITEVYFYFLAAGISLVAVWPVICIVGRIHGLCWTWRDERMTRQLGKADRAKRNAWRAAMEQSAKGLEAVALEGPDDDSTR